MNPKPAFRKNGHPKRAIKLSTLRHGIKFFAVLSLLLLWTPAAWAFDYSAWEALLKQHVKPTTLDGVRLNALPYKTLKTDPAFSKVVKQFEDFSPADLKTRNEKLAFWINAYNVFAVKMVLDHYPVDSIKDAGSLFESVWKKRVGTVGGQPITLDEIEHGILRKMGEPRIHMAIVCASVSCPDIREEAYWPDRLEAQLAAQSQHFLMNPGKGLRVDKERKTVYLSSIFDWFKEDFASKGGVRAFLAPYAPERNRAALQNSDYGIAYMDYNWDLNTL
ncbi:DUF547 domain-containing protein [Nitrospina watsonii]|uniref:DUF547 domain-containing protein n=1 Tax=Nitrospina watsonii TaxID=1323948 RepID=A0ABM9HBZ6_9BACT|nr:DUF547 domain-containing protein [Nitrospina watsonii]CAI2717688.1 conserved protein of unknown function [Nitrospina watsonii]